MPALLGLDWINWDSCALQLRDNCITEIYLLLKVSPPLSSIRKRRSYAESHRICSKVTARLVLCMVYVWICIQYKWFYSVLSHMEIVQLIAVEVYSLLPFAECAVWGWLAQLCGVGVTGVLLIAIWLLDNNQILLLPMGQKARPSVHLYDHLQISRPSYSLTPKRPEALLGWC